VSCRMIQQAGQASGMQARDTVFVLKKIKARFALCGLEPCGCTHT